MLFPRLFSACARSFGPPLASGLKGSKRKNKHGSNAMDGGRQAARTQHHRVKASKWAATRIRKNAEMINDCTRLTVLRIPVAESRSREEAWQGEENGAGKGEGEEGRLMEEDEGEEKWDVQAKIGRRPHSGNARTSSSCRYQACGGAFWRGIAILAGRRGGERGCARHGL